MKACIRKSLKALNTIKSKLLTSWAKHRCASFGTGSKVNRKSNFSRNTEVGSYCHFNGMVIRGTGKVYIGNLEFPVRFSNYSLKP
jgi:hypothetical protein